MNEYLWNIAATALGGFISAFVTFFVLKIEKKKDLEFLQLNMNQESKKLRIENLKKHYVDFCHLLLTAKRSITDSTEKR